MELFQASTVKLILKIASLTQLLEFFLFKCSFHSYINKLMIENRTMNKKLFTFFSKYEFIIIFKIKKEN